jgi:hypothetical protein
LAVHFIGARVVGLPNEEVQHTLKVLLDRARENRKAADIGDLVQWSSGGGGGVEQRPEVNEPNG